MRGIAILAPMKTILTTLLIVLGALGIAPAADEVDPADLWYRGYLLTQETEEHEKNGSYLEALSKLNEAFALFKTLSLSHPDYHTELVKHRLQLIAEKRVILKARMAPGEPTGESRVEALKSALEGLQNEKEKLHRELRRLQKSIEALEEEIEAGESPPKQGQLENFLRDQNGTLYAIEESTSPKVPSFWIKREYDGQTTYFIPLIETDETKAFSRLTPAPAVLQGTVISVDGE